MAETLNELTLAAGTAQLAEYPLPQALAELADQRTTGSVIVKRGGIEKRIFVRNGAPVFLESNAADEALDRFLIKRNLISEAAGFQLKSKAVEQQRDLGQVLLAEKVLGPNELYQMMKLCMGNAILSTFRWADGKISFDAAKPQMEGKILLKVNPGPLVVRGVCSVSPFDMISKHFLAVKCSRFRLNDDPREFVPQLKLNPLQGRIAQALERPFGPNEVAQEAEADMETVLRVLYALWLLKKIVPDDGAAAKSAATPATIPAAQVARVRIATKPAVEIPEPSSSKALTNDEKQAIDRFYDLARSGNYYELLGVDRRVTFSDLKSAFLKQCDAFSPMSFKGRPLSTHATKLEEIFLVLVRAFSTLAVPGLRQAYNAQLEANSTIKKTLLGVGQNALANEAKRKAAPAKKKPPPGEAEKSIELETHAMAIEEPMDASVLLRTGIAFLNARQPAEAVEQLEMAIEDNPNDAQSTALLGYALYLCDPISNVAKALDHLQRAASTDGSAAEPHLLLGRILEQEQHRENALAAYEACLTRSPAHSEAKEAATRLRKILRR